MDRILFFLLFSLLCSSCSQWTTQAEEDLRPIPITNNPRFLPPYQEALPGVGHLPQEGSP